MCSTMICRSQHMCMYTVQYVQLGPRLNSACFVIYPPPPHASVFTSAPSIHSHFRSLHPRLSRFSLVSRLLSSSELFCPAVCNSIAPAPLLSVSALLHLLSSCHSPSYLRCSAASVTTVIKQMNFTFLLLLRGLVFADLCISTLPVLLCLHRAWCVCVSPTLICLNLPVTALTLQLIT